MARRSVTTRRHRRPTGRVTGLAALLLAALLPLVGGAGEPVDAAPSAGAARGLASGFEDRAVLEGLTNPTTVRFASDGRVFVAEKSGIIKVFSGLDDPTPTVVADLRTEVHNYWDRGLLGFNLDPQFPAEPYLYVLYVRDAEPGGNAPRWGTAGTTSDSCPSPPGPLTTGCLASIRLSRLRLTGDVATGAEQVLVDDWCEQYPSHSAGDIEFGPDGSLYASAGDGASFTIVDYGQAGTTPNPCGDPPAAAGTALSAPTAEGGSLRAQDARTPADPLGLDGTVIRVDRATGAGVAANPWASGADPARRGGNWDRVIAYGLRNPFRMAFAPGTDDLYIGDVGGSGYEEVNRITDPGGAVENFGWPCYEGEPLQANLSGFDLCRNLYADAGAVTAPWFSYPHFTPLTADDGCETGSSSTAGVGFYEGGSYPDVYDGSMILADYSRNCIWAVPPTGDPVTLVDGAHGPVDVQIGPEGDVFYVDLAGGTVRRITWNTLAPPDRSAYVSDLEWRSSSNEWGPVERDTSNGENEALDGQTIRIGGVAYDKGLGIHANSAVDVPLGGNCRQLTAAIGVDDEVGSAGSVVFTVIADGEEVYRSQTLRGTDGATPLTVDLSGADTVRLAVTDAGDGQNADHADWAEAYLTCGPAGAVPLTDRDWVSAQNEWGPVEVDHSNGQDEAGDGGTLTLNGVTYERGLGVHAVSRVVYALGGDCTSFRSDIGLDDEMTGNGSVVFRVEGDGRPLYESTIMGSQTATRHLDVDIQGVDRLALVVDDGGDGQGWDHADWAGAALVCGSPTGPAAAHIDGPGAATHWSVGDRVSFRGGAEDGEGTALPASALTWSLVMQHCPETCHAHEIERFDGVSSGSFVAPDHEYPSHLELRLSAALPGGGEVHRRLDLDPVTVDLRFETEPSGLPLLVGGASAVTPFTRTVMAGSVNSVEAPASTAVPAGGTTTFSMWSDGGAAGHEIEALASGTYRATYRTTAVSRLSGSVTDRGTGAAVPGARVAVLRLADYSLVAGVVADRSGHFLTEVPAGTYLLYLIDPTGRHDASFHDSGGAAAAVSVPTGQTASVDASMVASRGAVAGTVVADGGGAVPGAWVITQDGTTAAPEVGAVADADGAFRVGDLGVGGHFLAYIDPDGAHVPEYSGGTAGVFGAARVPVGAGATAVADASLAPRGRPGGGAPVAGVVTEAGGGLALEGVFVVALRSADYQIVRGGRTDASGRYSLDLPGGSYRLLFLDPRGAHAMEWNAGHPYYDIARADAVAAPATVNADLPVSTGAIAGTVSADGVAATPVPGAWVVAIGARGVAAAGTTAADGRYTLAGLPVGTYRVVVLDPRGTRRVEYWDDKATYETSNPVPVTAGGTAAVSARLAPV